MCYFECFAWIGGRRRRTLCKDRWRDRGRGGGERGAKMGEMNNERGKMQTAACVQNQILIESGRGRRKERKE